MEKLTAVQIRNARPKEKPYKLSDGHGLYFHVSPTGKMTWRYRFKIGKDESVFTLGEYPEMGLEAARGERKDIRKLVKAGINPAEQKRKEKEKKNEQALALDQKKKDTFKAVALEWVDLQKERWSALHRETVVATLRREVFPDIGDLAVDEIRPPEILQILRRIEARDALELSRKVLQRMNAVFRYAVQTGKATFNPAGDMQGVLKTRKAKHMAAVSRAELPIFMKALRDGDLHINTKLALQFLILTAARSGEVRGAVWSEINLAEKVWRIPAARMKMSTPHSVPLSSQALAIVERMGRMYGQEGLVFPGLRERSKPLSENTMLYALYRLGFHSRATVHGFRASFSTIANEAGYDGDVIEKALAHEERNKVRAAYHRSEYLEQRRELMQWWGDLVYAF
jgi:integrase